MNAELLGDSSNFVCVEGALEECDKILLARLTECEAVRRQTPLQRPKTRFVTAKRKDRYVPFDLAGPWAKIQLGTRSFSPDTR